MKKKWIIIIGIFLLFCVSFLPLPILNFSPQIGIVSINEPIMDSEKIVNALNEFSERSDVGGIILRLNTPGGGVAASQEIYEKVKEISEKNDKPIIASMGSVAASGGYYIATAADTIIANKGTTTGSIGVIMTYPIAAELLDRIGLSFQSIKSGDFKDAGSFSRKSNDLDIEYFQDIVNNLHNQFVNTISYERGIPYEEVLKLANGKVFSGEQAFELGLIDILGTFDNSINLISELSGFDKKPKIIYPDEEKFGLLDILLGNKQIRLPFSNLNIFPLPEYSIYYGGRN